MVTTNTPRLGFHYYDDSLHYRAADLERWLPELQALGARWLTLLAPLNRAVPEPFISGLLAAGIQPVLHLRPVAPIHAVDLAELRPLLETYARWGVRYLCVFDRPNTRAAWTAADWSRPGLVDRFLELWLPLAGAQLAAGLEPVFPALEPGGDYWDTLFLEAALDGLLAREQGDLLPRLTFAFTAFTRGRPPAWGAGGPRRWPQTRPYLTPAGSQDQCGFRGFEWLSAVITDRLGAPRPLLCLAGGAAPEQRGDPAHPASEAGDHCQVNAALAALALGEVAGAGLALPDEGWPRGSARRGPGPRSGRRPQGPRARVSRTGSRSSIMCCCPASIGAPRAGTCRRCRNTPVISNQRWGSPARRPPERSSLPSSATSRVSPSRWHRICNSKGAT
ncbi:MAG: hypothetical protein HY784_03390 [Chloroflexi bacterium]|nr:hypothetical protein [Chloroflexota bacterium]